jgi:RND family efflux transporter MFP subunit
MDVDGPRVRDRVRVGEVQVYPSVDVVSIPEEASGGITFLKEQQWETDFNVSSAQEREIPYTIEVSGEIIPASGRVAEVSAPVSGLARAEANLSAPSPGERVGAGQAMAVLSPTTQDNSYAQARSRVERLRRDVDRLHRLFDAEAIPEVRLTEARHDLEVAESVLEAMGGESNDDGYRFIVRSPISGTVQTRHFTPGQRVEAGEPLFEVINSDVVWLRLRIPARHADVVEAAGDAVFSPEGSQVQFRTSRVVSVASAIDPESRTLPVILAVDNPQNGLKIGQFVQAQLSIGGTRSGVAVPNDAIMHEDGQPVLYVQTGGESFDRRIVVLGPTDGTATLIASGLSAGEYVVTEGAYEVYLSSLGTTEIGDHGHPH